jgi:hypothetical protein
MDAQGRALITDHGAFALFNLYLPATTDPTSPRFKVSRPRSAFVLLAPKPSTIIIVTGAVSDTRWQLECGLQLSSSHPCACRVLAPAGPTGQAGPAGGGAAVVQGPHSSRPPCDGGGGPQHMCPPTGPLRLPCSTSCRAGEGRLQQVMVPAADPMLLPETGNMCFQQ